MESLREIVRKKLEELRSREDAIYFQGTIKALEEIESRLNDCIRQMNVNQGPCSGKKNPVQGPLY